MVSGDQMTTPISPNDPKQLVEEGYDHVADRYAHLEGDSDWPRLRWLARLLTKLVPASHVLDLGCGSGEPADVEIAKTHRLTGVDISQAQIKLARKNVPTGTFIHADAASVEFPDGTFNAVVSFYTLEHIPREEHPKLLKRVYNWLTPGGFFLLSTEAGEYNGIGEWLGVPMYFSSYDPETLKDYVIQEGFEIIETAIENQWEEDHEVPYLWLLARRH